MKKDDRVFLTPEQAEERIRSIARDLRQRYVGIAEVRVDSEEHQYYSVVPNNPNACGFSFILDQWLDFEAAGRRWELDWTEEGIRVFWRLVASVAAGRIPTHKAVVKTFVEIAPEDGEAQHSTVVSGLLSLFAPRDKIATTFEPW